MPKYKLFVQVTMAGYIEIEAESREEAEELGQYTTAEELKPVTRIDAEVYPAYTQAYYPEEDEWSEEGECQ